MKMDLALNNLQRLICHKTQLTTTTTSNSPEIISISMADSKKISGRKAPQDKK